MANHPNRSRRATAAETEAALRAVYREAKALMDDLEAAAREHDGMPLAAALMAAVHAHIDPLRAAVGDVEFHDQAADVMRRLAEPPAKEENRK